MSGQGILRAGPPALDDKPARSAAVPAAPPP